MEGASGVGGGVVSVSTRMGQFFGSRGRFVEGEGWRWAGLSGVFLVTSWKVSEGWVAYQLLSLYGSFHRVIPREGRSRGCG